MQTQTLGEQELFEIVKTALPSFTEQGKDQNLLQLGLTSIQIMHIANELKLYGVKISFAKLATDPRFCSWLKLAEKNTDKVVSPISVENKNEPFKLTDIQRAYWVGRNQTKNLGNVSCHEYLGLDGEGIEYERLVGAWQKLYTYHPMLRVCILNNGMQQVNSESSHMSVDLYDLREEKTEQVKKQLHKIRHNYSHRKLDIENGQTVGLALSLLPDNKARLHFDLDLLAADVMSFYIIMDDLAKLYNGKEKPLADPSWNFGA